MAAEGMDDSPQPSFPEKPFEPESEFKPIGSSGFLGWIKNILIFAALVVVVVSSFWISFQLGKRILLPVKRPEKIQAAVPEAPPSVKALQELEKVAQPEPDQKPEVKPEVKVVEEPQKIAVRTVYGGYYKVHVGVLDDKIKARELGDKLESDGFDVYIKPVDEGYRVQVGAFRTQAEAEALQSALSEKGFSAEIIEE